MPQYDAYEDPLPTATLETPATQHHSHTDANSNKILTEVQEGAVFNENYHIENHGNPHAALEFHRRHSLLGRRNSQLINCTSAGEPDPMLSPKILNDKEKLELRAAERSQQEDDDMRMTNDSERHAQEEKREREKSDGVSKVDEQTHIIKGGWMHRSRGSCELLRERNGY